MFVWVKSNTLKRIFSLCLLMIAYCSISAQSTTPYNITFSHSTGQWNTSLDARGMQPVHELTYVYYMNTGETRTLVMPISGDWMRLKGYSRWYDYNADALTSVVSGMTYSKSDSRAILHYTNYGVISYQETLGEGVIIQPLATITFNGTAVKIACDVSDYADFNVTRSGSNISSFVEPTLSYRVIFDIRPASEIASKINTSTPYESYDFIAPASSDILLSTAMNSYGSSSSYYKPGSEQITAPTMYRSEGNENNYNPVSLDVRGDRVYTVQSPSAGNVYYYELRDGDYKIARWRVESRDISEVGPIDGTIVSNHDMDLRYNLAAKQDFDVDPIYLDTVDYGNDIEGHDYFVISSKPLNWDESSYGFVYPYGSGSAGLSKQKCIKFAEWGEYVILQDLPDKATWLTGHPQDIFDFNNPGVGCFMYLDATDAPGLIANLAFDGNICPNSSVYVSARVNNFCVDEGTDKVLPNLNITLSGVDENGIETALKTYTTGINKFSKDKTISGNWFQIFFEVGIGEQSFSRYRVRIENNNNSAYGNDLAIDDIRIYTSKNPVQSLEGITACGIKTQQELIDAENGNEKSVALLRVDYKSEAFLADVSGNVNVYYRWVKGDNPQGGNNDTVLNLAYINAVGSGNNAYGVYTLPKNQDWNSINSSLKYNSINDFIARHTVNDGDVFFLQEEVVRTSGVDTVPILYIVHKSNEFKKYSTYSCLVSSSDDFNVECSGMFTTKVQNCKQLLIDSIPQEVLNLRFKTLTGERDYELSTRVYYNDPNLKGQVNKATPYCDWIVGVDDRFIQANLTAAFVHFRSVYPTEEASVNQPVSGVFTQADLDSLLKYEKYLILYKRAIMTNIPGDGTTVQHIAYPIMGSCDDATIPVCPNPMRIYLRSEYKYCFGKVDVDDMPEDIQGAPAIVRIAQSKVNELNNSFTLKINGVKYIPKIGTDMYLYRTDDADAQSFVGTSVYTFSGNVSDIVKNNDITFSRNNSTIKMKPGYDYKFSARYDSQPNDTAYGCFIINVVPDIIIFAPKAENPTWHNDDNWVDQKGDPAIIPVEYTKVILPAGNTALKYMDAEDYRESAEINYHLKYIYGFEPNRCGSIYFPVGAKMSGQQYLVYDSAYVDVPVSKGAYSLMGLPLQTVYSGDLFIPKKGNVIGNNFIFSPEHCDSRLFNKVTQKVYNSTTHFWSYVKGNTKDSVSTAVAGWGEPANSLSEKYTNTALAVMVIDTAVQDFIQLPKTDSVYYFYAIRKATGEEYQVPERYGKADIIHDASCYKLLYQGDVANPETTITYTNVVADSWFLVTNPFMGDLSMQAFMYANTDVIDGFYYTYQDGMMNAVPVTAETVVAPYAAFFIHTKTAAQSVNIKYNPETMVVNTAAVTPMPANAKDNTQIHGARTLRIVAENGNSRSVATVTEDAYGSNDYDSQEDADLLMFNDNLTPFAVYTRIGNTPVMVNAVRTIDMIPLSVSVLDTAIGNIELSFFGTENFTRPVYLYDALTDINTEIYSGMKIDFDGREPDAVRYYLNIDRSDVITFNDDVDNDKDVIISSDNNGINILSKSELKNITVYDIAGHLIDKYHNIYNTTFEIYLPVGVYVVEIETENGVSNNKVIVK